MRQVRFVFNITCASDGRADMARVEQLVDLAMQDLVFDDEFVAALDEKEAIQITVIPVKNG